MSLTDTYLAICQQVKTFQFGSRTAEKANLQRPERTADLQRSLQQLREADRELRELEAMAKAPGRRASEAARSQLKEAQKARDEAYASIRRLAATTAPDPLKEAARQARTWLESKGATKTEAHPWVWYNDLIGEDNDNLCYGAQIVADGLLDGPYTVGLLLVVTPVGLRTYVSGDRGRVSLFEMPFGPRDEFKDESALVRRLTYHLELDKVFQDQHGLNLGLTPQETAKLRELGPHIQKIKTGKDFVRVLVNRENLADHEQLSRAFQALLGRTRHHEVKTRSQKTPEGTIYTMTLVPTYGGAQGTLLARVEQIRELLELDDDEFRSLQRWARGR